MRELQFFLLVLVTALLMRGCMDVLETIFEPLDTTLVIVADTPLLALSVRLDGRERELRPRFGPAGYTRTVQVSGLRPRGRDSMIEVSWRTIHGEGSLRTGFGMERQCAAYLPVSPAAGLPRGTGPGV